MEKLKNTIAKSIEHTLLKPNAVESDIHKLCQEALKFQFFGVCVNSCWIPLAATLLKGSQVKLVSTAAFPLGACETGSKIYEVERAFLLGAHEVDFVANIGWIKEGSWRKVMEEFRDIVKASNKKTLKVILETCLLTDNEKRETCLIAAGEGIAFVKTSTGFSTSGATLEDVKLMKLAVGDRAMVKASGGIRDIQTALNMLEAGATRLGTSSGVVLVNN